MSIDFDELVVQPLVDQVYGEPIVITYKATGAAVPGNGVYDDAYVEMNPANGMEVSDTRPVVGIRTCDWPVKPGQGDLVYVPRTNEWLVVNKPKPDSHGWSLLLLNITTVPTS